MKMSQEDAKRYIKKQIADYIVTEFGVQDIKKPFRCLNPAHEDRHPSMSLDKEHNRVKCFSSSCGASYDILDLIALAHNIPPNDSRSIFQKAYEIFNLDVEGYSRDTDHQPVKEKNTDPNIERYLSECHSRVHETDYFQQRGLSEEVINKYRLGYDPHFTKNTGAKYGMRSLYRQETVILHGTQTPMPQRVTGIES
jgi:DNA primase